VFLSCFSVFLLSVLCETQVNGVPRFRLIPGPRELPGIDSIMQEPKPNRRRFLDGLTMLVVVAIGALFLVPALWYLLAPLGKRGSRRDFALVGSVAEIPKGEWKLLSLELVQEDGWRETKTRRSVWVRKEGDAERDISVRSSICPHLGCPVNFNAEKNEFLCPCHGGIFDASGNKVSGPPPRSLDPLEFEVRAGMLWVRWQNFKIGADQPIEVNL
jgi:menaquinol-cytochrome c reductase iron-sulfur subunit